MVLSLISEWKSKAVFGECFLSRLMDWILFAQLILPFDLYRRPINEPIALLGRIVKHFNVEFANLFIGRSDAPEYDIIWTENNDAIDSFISEILTLEECS